MASTRSQPKRGICPVCLKKVAIDADAKSVLHCQCGTVLFVSRDGRLISSLEQESPKLASEALATSEPAMASVAIDVGDATEADGLETDAPDEGQEQVPRARRRRSSSLGMVGLGLVVLVVIGSVVFRMTRSPHTETAATPKRVEPKADAETLEIESGQLAAWVLEAPAPALSSVPTKTISAKGDKPDAGPKDDRDRGKGPDSDTPGYRQFTAITDWQPPDPSPTRSRLVIPKEKIRESVFRDAYEVAYDQYETLMSMDANAKPNGDYRKQLATTFAHTQQAYDSLVRRQDTKNLGELRYLLAYLSFQAGLLEEAMVYGMWAARLGDAAEGSTRDAAFLSLAATQEASEVHWGDPNEVGELNQMRDVIELIEQKWPDETTDEMWLNLARRYLAFGANEAAATAFQRVPASSPLKSDASFGAGEAYWRVFRRRASPSTPASIKTHQSWLDKALRQFDDGITRSEKGLAQPTRELMSAQFSAIRIAALRASNRQILKRFNQGKFPLAKSITARKQHPKGQVTVEPAFCRAVIQMMHDVLKHDGQTDKALITMERLEKLLPAGMEAPDSSAQYRDHFVTEVKSAIASSKLTVATLEGLERDFGRFQDKISEVPLNDLLWMAYTMGELGMGAPSAPLAERCFALADQIATRLVASHQPDAGRLRSIQTEQIKWQMAVGKKESAYSLILEVLATTPNVVDLQLRAAKMLEERAVASDSIDELKLVMDGPGDKAVNIWGWSKLAVVLQQSRQRGEASDELTESLLEAQFHLARCRWLLARAYEGRSTADSWARLLSRQQATFSLLVPPDDPTATRWQSAMENLKLP